MNQEAYPCQTSHTSSETQGQLVEWGVKKIWQKLLAIQFLPCLVPSTTTNSNCPWVSKEVGGMKTDCSRIDHIDDQGSKMKLIKCCNYTHKRT